MPSNRNRTITLSAAIIARNEEKHLHRCLESIRSVTDEIVVVDTGSVDRTMVIAAEFGARLFSMPWPESFAAARNRALEYCRGDWILYIDADERLENVCRDFITPFLNDPENVAYTVRFFQRKHYTSYQEHRIFRNDPRIRFRGIIHETILPSIDEKIGNNTSTIGSIPMTIRHDGYDTDQTSKHLRNLPLLTREIENRPNYSYLWWHLGCVYMGLNRQNDAEKAWAGGPALSR